MYDITPTQMNGSVLRPLQRLNKNAIGKELTEPIIHRDDTRFFVCEALWFKVTVITTWRFINVPSAHEFAGIGKVDLVQKKVKVKTNLVATLQVGSVNVLLSSC